MPYTRTIRPPLSVPLENILPVFIPGVFTVAGPFQRLNLGDWGGFLLPYRGVCPCVLRGDISEILNLGFARRCCGGCCCPPCEACFFGSFNNLSAFAQTCRVPSFSLFNPSSSIARACFFILPRILRSPYAAALFAVLLAIPYNASFRISRPSSCIHDKLNAACRATEELSQYIFSLNSSSSSTACWSFSRPLGTLFFSFIASPLTESAGIYQFLEKAALCQVPF
jgi:hypothetical protein